MITLKNVLLGNYSSNFQKVINAIVTTTAIKATSYLSEKLVINATRKRFNGKIVKSNIEILLKIGNPNFAERKFIKLYKKAGEKFPIKKIQLKFLK
jgi:hypothetical protein